MEVSLEATEEEIGRVEPGRLRERVFADLLAEGNPMEKLTAAGMLMEVDPEILREKIERVKYRLRSHGHPRFVKEYPGRPRVKLPEPRDLDAPLGTLVRTRRSKKLFAPAALTLEELSTLLFHAYGRTGSSPSRTREHELIPFRAAPTSGNLQGTEVYLLATNVDGLPEGIYHYDGVAHELDVLSTGMLDVKTSQIWLQPETLKNAACFLAFTIDLTRGVWKYDSRYLHTALLDTGVILGFSQLAAHAMGIDANPLTGFKPRTLAGLLNIDGIHEVPAVTMAVGRRDRSDFAFEP